MMSRYRVPFTKVYRTGRELEYIQEAIDLNRLAGDGVFTQRCHRLLEQMIGCVRAFLTTSGTAALEMAAILSGVEPGDEVIMPSFTFVSTANAFVLRGAVPVFVDIEPETMNIDPGEIAPAITDRTAAIVPVHYAGIPCQMDEIMSIATSEGLLVIEDAAQAILSRYRGRPVGSFGQMAALSFHETKNLSSGEGGALLINDPSLVERAEVVREKGTNRSRFFRGQIDKYTWLDIGSSYLPNELTAAFLYAQLEHAAEISKARQIVWDSYHRALEPLEQAGKLRRPRTTPEGSGNAHIYYVLVGSIEERTRIITQLDAAGVCAVFHYIPLHSSPAGRRFGRVSGQLAVTEDVSERILRLPLWPEMTNDDVELVVQTLVRALTSR